MFTIVCGYPGEECPYFDPDDDYPEDPEARCENCKYGVWDL